MVIENRKMEKRCIFVIMDGQNIHDSSLKYYYVDINEHLQRMIADKVFLSPNQERLNLFEKLNASGPSYAI